MAPTIRTAKRLLLGREIAHMIDKAGVSQATAASMIETSQGRIAGLISGTGNITPGDLLLLASGLGFDDEGYREALLELRRDSHKRGFWSTGYNRAYGDDVRLLVDLEKRADQIRSVQLEVVPGLLQCEAYTRAMHAGQPEVDGLTTEERVRARLARQEILTKTDPPLVHCVLSESSLRRMWAPADVMREQIEHLITLSQRSNILIQVLPFDMPLLRTSSMTSIFVLLRVPSPGAAGPLELAYTEGEGDIRYLDDKKALAAHDSAWARLTSTAASVADSRDFMAQVASEFADRHTATA